MKCRVDPLESGHQNFPTTASQWHNHKNTHYFTHLPQPAMMQAYIRQGCHQGPHKEGKWSQSKKKSYKNKLLCNSPSVSPKLQIFKSAPHMKGKSVAARAMNAEQESGTSRTPERKFLCEKIQQHLLLGHKLRSRGWIRGMCIKSALLSWFPHFFLVYTKVFVIYTHLITVGH